MTRDVLTPVPCDVTLETATQEDTVDKENEGQVTKLLSAAATRIESVMPGLTSEEVYSVDVYSEGRITVQLREAAFRRRFAGCLVTAYSRSEGRTNFEARADGVLFYSGTAGVYNGDYKLDADGQLQEIEHQAATEGSAT